VTRSPFKRIKRFLQEQQTHLEYTTAFQKRRTVLCSRCPNPPRTSAVDRISPQPQPAGFCASEADGLL
jgi:hypothetical protein